MTLIVSPIMHEHRRCLLPPRRCRERLDVLDKESVGMASFDMETRSIHRNLSPLDHRYWESNSEIFDQLSEILSEEAAVRYCARVEAAIARAHLRREGLLTDSLSEALERAALEIDPARVAAEEAKTQHNIRALVNVYQQLVPAVARPYVHLAATSVDVLDTASSMKVRDAVERVLLPLIVNVGRRLCTLADEHADTVQIGRTHGQFAVPVTFGFAMAEYAGRLAKSAQAIDRLSSDLRGKFAGAVGAYNALRIVTESPIDLESEVITSLGLKPGDQSNQLVEPEYMLRVLLECNVAFGILANLADDMRNLQRSEISEVREAFDPSQVGSSTMPHKRNPWNWEHIKSLWKAFAPRVMTFYMDQISEHQRDLTNSASSRFVAEYLAGLAAAFNRAQRVLRRVEPDIDAMGENIARAGDLSLAEPAYILLALAGNSDAHERVRIATLGAAQRRESLVRVLQEDQPLWQMLSDECEQRLGVSADRFFGDVTEYIGIASQKARATVGLARERLDGISVEA